MEDVAVLPVNEEPLRGDVHVDVEVEDGEDDDDEDDDDDDTEDSFDLYAKGNCSSSWLEKVRKFLSLLVQTLSTLFFSFRSAARDVGVAAGEAYRSTRSRRSYDGEDYDHMYAMKVMALKDLNMPPLLLETYCDLNNPENIQVIDRTVSSLHELTNRMTFLRELLSLEGNVVQNPHIRRSWQNELQSCAQSREIYFKQLTDHCTSCKVPYNMLAEVADSSLREASRAKSRQGMLKVCQLIIKNGTPDGGDREWDGPVGSQKAPTNCSERAIQYQGDDDKGEQQFLLQVEEGSKVAVVSAEARPDSDHSTVSDLSPIQIQPAPADQARLLHIMEEDIKEQKRKLLNSLPSS